MGDVTLVRKKYRDAVREYLSGRNYAQRIGDLLDQEWLVVVTDKEGVPLQDDFGKVVVIDKTRELSAKCDKMLKLLNKTVPDLASIRIEDGAGEPITVRVAKFGSQHPQRMEPPSLSD